MDNYWVLPIIALVSVSIVLLVALDVRTNTPERYIEPPIIIPKKIVNNPYVEFCNPGGFAPDKLIQNSTHKFDHDICVWQLRK